MSNFYARYVPPAKSSQVSNPPPPALEKRKREPETASREKKSKKLKTTTRSEPLETAPSTDHHIEGATATNRSARSNSENVIDKYRVTKNVSDEISVKMKKPKPSATEDKGHDVTITESAKRKDKKREKSRTAQVEYGDGTVEEEHDRRRSSVLSKFAKAKQQENKDVNQHDRVSKESATELHGLEPIPQPEEVDTVPETPTYSTLPAWQQSPTTVPLTSTATFESLGVPSDLLDNLKKVNIEQAFPVQASVVPLLLESSSKHHGDVCVSAATGSGKTLAYVLPIISSLRNAVGTKLRAVIVVPTRELVKQVRELCEICAAGSSLTIATAVGSKTLREEQQLLVEEQRVYDMEEFQREQQAKVDWSTFSLENLLRKVQAEEPFASLGYVSRYKSKADVLITTPGRLVEHLKNTTGFNLDHVKWLVVDEADRLLNESYQEWIDAVSPALTSQAATRERDELLESMRMAPPQRRVTKVLLSATMTRDVSKLNALGLRNPKLIVLTGSSQLETPQTTAGTVPPNDDGLVAKVGGDAFHLPPSLIETAVPVPDGSEKPLYLLTLLKNEIGILSANKNYLANGCSSEDESTSESESGSDPESDSTSDSDHSSDTSSSGSSVTDSSSSSDEPDESEQSSYSTEKSRKKKNGVNDSERIPRALVFTRSTASANRLSRLLSLLWPALPSHMSTLTRSTASSASSRRALSLFRRSKISVLICTDRASRGLDVPGLEHVVSYDVPTSPLTYVHRVGRTARAGKQGQAWTIVEHREGAWFWREIGGKGMKSSSTGEVQLKRSSKIRRLALKLDDDKMKQQYDAALTKLGTEARGG